MTEPEEKKKNSETPETTEKRSRSTSWLIAIVATLSLLSSMFVTGMSMTNLPRLFSIANADAPTFYFVGDMAGGDPYDHALYSYHQGNLEEVLPAGFGWEGYFDLTDDCAQIVYISPGGEGLSPKLTLLETETNVSRTLEYVSSSGGVTDMMTPRFSPDGSQVVFMYENSTSRGIAVYDIQSGSFVEVYGVTLESGTAISDVNWRFTGGNLIFSLVENLGYSNTITRVRYDLTAEAEYRFQEVAHSELHLGSLVSQSVIPNFGIEDLRQSHFGKICWEALGQ